MSETFLQLTLENGQKAYKEGSEADRALLSRLFPGKLEPKPILERVTTLEEACKELDIDYEDLFDACEDDYEKAEVAIKTFVKALIEGKNPKDCFYYPYFYKSFSGFSFVASNFVYGASTAVGSRLRVDSSEKAKHLGKCMESYYKTYLLGE
jgi:hypothetical protein